MPSVAILGLRPHCRNARDQPGAAGLSPFELQAPSERNHTLLHAEQSHAALWRRAGAGRFAIVLDVRRVLSLDDILQLALAQQAG